MMAGAEAGVDLLSALAKSLQTSEHAGLAADAIHDNGGYISRGSAVALARRLLEAAGDQAAEEMLATERGAGYRQGYEAGWRACREQFDRGLGGRLRGFGRWARRRGPAAAGPPASARDR